MNNVCLAGRLTKAPEARVTQGENPTTIVRFTLAVDRRLKREGEASADFISCVAFGKTAQFIEKYTDKGTKLNVVGRIQTGSYTNKDGQKIYTTEVVVETAEFGESKKSQDGASAEDTAEDGFMDIPEGLDEELPFV